MNTEPSIESFRKIVPNDPLIVFGNGPSLNNIDFNLLRGYDSYGLNGFYKLCYKHDFWPTYYSHFDDTCNKHRMHEIQHLICDTTCKIKYFIFFKTDNEQPSCSTKLVYITPKQYKIQQHKETSWEYRVETAINEISKVKNITSKEANALIIKAISDFNLSPNVTHTELIKRVLGQPVTDNEVCIPREEVTHPAEPASLSSFYYYGGSSAITACRMGAVMGYKKIILLGVDCTYDSNTPYAEGTYDKNDPIYTKQQEILESINSHLAVKLKDFSEFPAYYHKLITTGFKEFSKNNPHIDIVNCGGSMSKLDCFRRGELEKELNHV